MLLNKIYSIYNNILTSKPFHNFDQLVSTGIGGACVKLAIDLQKELAAAARHKR